MRHLKATRRPASGSWLLSFFCFGQPCWRVIAKCCSKEQLKKQKHSYCFCNTYSWSERFSVMTFSRYWSHSHSLANHGGVAPHVHGVSVPSHADVSHGDRRGRLQCVHKMTTFMCNARVRGMRWPSEESIFRVLWLDDMGQITHPALWVAYSQHVMFFAIDENIEELFRTLSVILLVSDHTLKFIGCHVGYFWSLLEALTGALYGYIKLYYQLSQKTIILPSSAFKHLRNDHDKAHIHCHDHDKVLAK